MKTILATTVLLGWVVLTAAPANAAPRACNDIATATDEIEGFKSLLDDSETVELAPATRRELRASAKQLKKLGEQLAKTGGTKEEKGLGKSLATSAINLDAKIDDSEELLVAYEKVVDTLGDLTFVTCDAK